MNANSTITYSVSHILFKYIYFPVIFFISLERNIGIRERSGKVHANVKQRIIHISDSAETSDFE